MNITHLPDIELEYLLSFLDSTSLYHLSLLHDRFEDFITNSKRLWRRIDARAWPNTEKKVKYCTDRIHEQTSEVKLRAECTLLTSPAYEVLDEAFYLRISKFENLKILALENLEICPKLATIKSFPNSVEELSFRKSSILTPEQFFRHSNQAMSNLRVLILDECRWVKSSLFMSISKYPKLEILSLYKCPNLENSVPYMSISGQYGFKKLKILDARVTMLGNTLLRSLRRSQSVMGLYIQNTGISFKLDCLQKQYDYWKGGWAHDYPLEEMSNNVFACLDNDDFIDKPPSEGSQVDDSGLFDYQSRISLTSEQEYPKSMLYADPYHTTGCNCRRNGTPEIKYYHKGGARDPNSDESDSDDDEEGRRDRRNLFRTIRGLRRIVAYNGRSPLQERIPRGGEPIRRRRRLEPSERHRLRCGSPDVAAQNHRQFVDDDDQPGTSAAATAAEHANGSCCQNHSTHDGPGLASPQGDRLNNFDIDEAGPSTSYGPSTSTAAASSSRRSRAKEYFARANNRRCGARACCDGSGSETEGKRQRNEDDDDADHDRPGPSKRYHRDASSSCDDDQRPSTSRADDNGRGRRSPSPVQPQPPPPLIGEPAIVNILAPIPREGEANYVIQAEVMDVLPGGLQVGVINMGALQNLGRELPRDFVFRVVNAGHDDVEDKSRAIGLRWLSLRGYKKITDRTLKYLRNLNLEVLDLTYTSVTQAGIRHFIAEHPYCRVIHQCFCTCAPTMNL